MQLLKQSEATAARRRIPVRMVDSTDGKTAETGLTFIAGDIKISKNGGAEANHAGTVTELAGGLYYYEATAAELNTLGFLTMRVVKTGALDFVAVCQVTAIDPYDTVRLGLTAIASSAIVTGAVVTDAGNLANTFKTDLASTTTDEHKDKILKFTSGALSGQVRRVTVYNGTTKFITVVTGYTAAPAASDTFELLNR